MSPDVSTKTLETAWCRQRQWSETADRFKRSLLFWRSIVLGLAIVAAVAGAWSGMLDPNGSLHVLVGMLAAIAAIVAPILARLRLSPQDTVKWLRARSASEAFKAEIFQFRTRTSNYADEAATDNLSAAIEQISNSVEDLASITIPDVEVDDGELQDLSVGEYLGARVVDQIQNYYRPKAEQHALKATRYRNLHLWLMLLGAVLGVISSFVTAGVGPWVAVVTTVASSVVAHAAAGRHDELAIAFRATANRLEEITDRWEDRAWDQEPTLEQRTALVAACEEAISSENQSWHAKFRLS